MQLFNIKKVKKKKKKMSDLVRLKKKTQLERKFAVLTTMVKPF